MSIISWFVSTAHAQGLPALNLQVPSASPDNSAATGIPVLLNRILNLLIAIAWPLAFAGLVYSAYTLLTSAGQVEAYSTVKKNIGFIVTGIVVIISGLYVIRFIITVFGNH